MRRSKPGLRLLLGAMVLAGAVAGSSGARAFVTEWPAAARWDAPPLTVPGLGERSLDGGLRYSVQGGSYESYRDTLTWDVVPSVDDFQLAVEKAFAAWTTVDPVSGLGTNLSFTPDLGTTVQGPTGGGVDPRGAEIDLLAANDALSWNPGTVTQIAESWIVAASSDVTLTSGTTDYPGFSIWGNDITFNSNPEFIWTLGLFHSVLIHEIGHSLGLGDVEKAASTVSFLDDNYDGSSSASALATLTNSWALLVDPFDPSASPQLSFFTVANGDPGIDTPGVKILMESNLAEILIAGSGLLQLQNDDYGGRQFLYPFVIPEPSTGLLVMSGLLGFTARRRWCA